MPGEPNPEMGTATSLEIQDWEEKYSALLVSRLPSSQVSLNVDAVYRCAVAKS